MAEHLEADVDRYLYAASLNSAPPPIASDPLADGGTPVEQLLRVLGLAANASDPADNADSVGLHAARDAWTSEAAGTFSGEDAAAATQVITSIAGALGGAFTALLQPVGQLPQLLIGGAQQAVTAATSLVGNSSPIEPAPAVDSGPDPDTANVPAPDAVDMTDAHDIVVPPPVDLAVPAVPAPAASAATHPSGLTAAPVARVPATTPAPAVAPAMTGMPMMPLPAPTGAESAKADTKRIAVGPVRSRQPRVTQVIRTEAGAG